MVSKKPVIDSATWALVRGIASCKIFFVSCRREELIVIETICHGGLSDRQILQVTDYINHHLSDSLKIEDLATHLGISKFNFSRLFKKSIGISPHQYVMQQRIERAKQLLIKADFSISNIALKCGFNSHAHLGKYFRTSTGMTPKAYRQTLQ